MYTVYVLRDNNNHYYKGMTNNINRRLREHKIGKTKTTKKMNGLKLVYSEEYNTRIEARKKEKYFKSAAGRKFLKLKLHMDA